MHCKIVRYIAVHFQKNVLFAVDFLLDSVGKCHKSTISAQIVTRLQILACCRVPLLELPTSTAGTQEFHPWNFLELVVDCFLSPTPAEGKLGLPISTKKDEKCAANTSFCEKIYCKTSLS